MTRAIPSSFHLNNGRARVYQTVQTRRTLKTIPLFCNYHQYPWESSLPYVKTMNLYTRLPTFLANKPSYCSRYCNQTHGLPFSWEEGSDFHCIDVFYYNQLTIIFTINLAELISRNTMKKPFGKV